VTYRPDTVTQTNSLPPASVSTHATARVGVLLGLTVVTGVVDAVSFLGLGHIFTANMTGNVVFLGFALGGGLDVSAWRSATALVAFALGSVYGGWLANRPGRDPAQPLAIAMRLESLLLALAAIAALLVNGAASAAVYPVIVLTAVAMGLRNAVVRKAGVADLATTVLTGTITGLMADSPIVGGTGERHTRRTLFDCRHVRRRGLRRSAPAQIRDRRVVDRRRPAGSWPRDHRALDVRTDGASVVV
jgi:uncharacterized membrane protein YoaK (UPF0700 family)